MPSVRRQNLSKTHYLYIAGFGVFIFLFIFVIAFSAFKNNTVKRFKQIQASQNINTVFYDIDQKPFHIIRGVEDRKYVALKQISRNLQKAVVAVEDARFFRHFGFDPIRLVSIVIRALTPNKSIQGASTITQQLVKLTLLSPEQTISRKIKELFMAVALEMEYSKEQILEFYLNKVYLGSRNYGVENASLNYFHKSTSDLTIAEAAFIAGLIKKPEGYSPFVNLKKARERQLLVLKRLRTLDWISLNTYKKSVNEHLLIRERRKDELQLAPYFISHIMLKLKQIYGHNAVYGGGLHIFTTLDSNMQKAMEKAIENRMIEERTFEEIAGVSIDPSTGFVNALVGGEDFFKSEFNRVTQAMRQPGSSFKPILYTAALENGILPTDVFWDEPTQYTRVVDDELEVYEPGNFSGEHKGQITVSYALRTSNNVVSVQILNNIGIPKLVQKAREFGIEIPGERGLCLALGCGETTLLKLVNAYSAFANQGYLNDPVFVLKILDNQGNLLEKHSPADETKVVESDIAFTMNRLLQDVVNLGTGGNARIKTPSGGKTGTSDDSRDAWYVGFTADLVTGFWIGNDDNEPMYGEVGGKTPARLWKAYMNSLPKPEVQKSFAENENYEEYLVCDNSGQLATAWCPNKAWYVLTKEHPLLSFCELHSGEEVLVDVCRSSGKLATQYCPIDEVETKSFVHGTEPKEKCDVHTSSSTSESFSQISN